MISNSMISWGPLGRDHENFRASADELWESTDILLVTHDTVWMEAEANAQYENDRSGSNRDGCWKGVWAGNFKPVDGMRSSRDRMGSGLKLFWAGCAQLARSLTWWPG
jgi:hypothetical protein